MLDDGKVSPQEIIAAAGAEKPVRGTFLQRTGLTLAVCVGSLIAIVTLAIMGKWISSVPPAPVIPPGADATTVKAILENYKALQQIAMEPYTALFEMIVVKVLLPIFASILGYIFGSRSDGKEG